MKFKDKRRGKLVVVSHCILDQNARVSGLARYSAIIDEVVEVLRKYDVGFLQMPCPELIYAGAKRPRKTKEEYDTTRYRKYCKQIAVSTAEQLEELVKANIRVVAVLGIEGSPSCGIGDSPEETGILMEELLLKIKQMGRNIPIHAINTSKLATDLRWLEKILKRA